MLDSYSVTLIGESRVCPSLPLSLTNPARRVCSAGLPGPKQRSIARRAVFSCTRKAASLSFTSSCSVYESSFEMDICGVFICLAPPATFANLSCADKECYNCQAYTGRMSINTGVLATEESSAYTNGYLQKVTVKFLKGVCLSGIRA
jgi:hypothetical protein